jgi:hypothetical protein
MRRWQHYRSSAAGVRGVETAHGGSRMALRQGDAAPDFKLACAIGESQGEFQLSSTRGKAVVIQFYALDFTPV